MGMKLGSISIVIVCLFCDGALINLIWVKMNDGVFELDKMEGFYIKIICLFEKRERIEDRCICLFVYGEVERLKSVFLKFSLMYFFNLSLSLLQTS